MENTYPENVVYGHEQNLESEKQQPKETLVKKEKPILLRVFYKVFLGFFVEIGMGIFNFFKRYIVLIWNCLKFLWRPNADEHTKANEKTLENAKETFEFILIITAITLFSIKQDWIESTAELKEVYGNDIQQYFMEFIFFLIYAAAFFAVLVILVLVGRLLRKLFKSIESRDVTDKVFINLNNIFFILTAIYAFIKKCEPGFNNLVISEDDSWMLQMLNEYAIPLTIIVFIFFIRLVMINKLTFSRVLFYCIITPALVSIILSASGFMLTAFFSGL